MPGVPLHPPRSLRGALAARVGPALVAVLAVVLAACSSGPADPPESFDPGAPQLTVHSERFESAELQVPANNGFELVLFNKDSEAHNISIYADEGHSQPVYRGALTGNGTKVYHVQALAPGTYYFMCDVHPAMKGTLVAAAG